MRIEFKKINKDIPLPVKATKDAVCMDVVASEIEQNGDFNEFVTVKLGFATAIPRGCKGCIVPRSSFTQKGWVMQNSPAQIDSDYRGEWMIKFEAIPIDVENHKVLYPDFPYKVGDRCAQIYFERVEEWIVDEVDELEDTQRGAGGFGSTGN